MTKDFGCLKKRNVKAVRGLNLKELLFCHVVWVKFQISVHAIRLYMIVFSVNFSSVNFSCFVY